VKSKLVVIAMLGLAAACSSDPKRDWNAVENGGTGTASGADGGTRSARTDAGKVNGGDDGVCGKHSLHGDKATADMLIVLDRSGSMAPQGNDTGTDRWTGSRDAVVEVTGQFDDSINFGLMTFPANNGGGGGRDDQLNVATQCGAGTINVDIEPNAGDDIRNALQPMRPAGFTPTAATLEAALAIIGSPEVADQSITSPKYVLLVTDGDPNCSADFGGVGGGGGGGRGAAVDPRARMETIAAIEKLTDAGVQTFVVGFQTGQSSFADQLDKMAAAGGTGDTKHHSVESGADLTQVFAELAGRAQSCSFALSATVDPQFVLVSVGKKPRKFGNEADGWVLGGDKKTVTLTGTACTDAQKGQLFEVEVQCDPVTVI
jgi:hypothetical protein